MPGAQAIAPAIEPLSALHRQQQRCGPASTVTYASPRGYGAPSGDNSGLASSINPATRQFPARAQAGPWIRQATAFPYAAVKRVTCHIVDISRAASRPPS